MLRFSLVNLSVASAYALVLGGALYWDRGVALSVALTAVVAGGVHCFYTAEASAPRRKRYPARAFILATAISHIYLSLFLISLGGEITSISFVDEFYRRCFLTAYEDWHGLQTFREFSALMLSCTLGLICYAYVSNRVRRELQQVDRQDFV